VCKNNYAPTSPCKIDWDWREKKEELHAIPIAKTNSFTPKKVQR